MAIIINYILLTFEDEIEKCQKHPYMTNDIDIVINGTNLRLILVSYFLLNIETNVYICLLIFNG